MSTFPYYFDYSSLFPANFNISLEQELRRAEFRGGLAEIHAACDGAVRIHAAVAGLTHKERTGPAPHKVSLERVFLRVIAALFRGSGHQDVEQFRAGMAGFQNFQ